MQGTFFDSHKWALAFPIIETHMVLALTTPRPPTDEYNTSLLYTHIASVVATTTTGASSASTAEVIGLYIARYLCMRQKWVSGVSERDVSGGRLSIGNCRPFLRKLTAHAWEQAQIAEPAYTRLCWSDFVQAHRRLHNALQRPLTAEKAASVQGLCPGLAMLYLHGVGCNAHRCGMRRCGESR
jgi:hypothetical protein